ncbi:ArdC family protein [Novosphingobium sp. UBA1939]|uniref:ArdC family protein n=1 Tax=Novosphingobium sp. UBA1939 TaxID=1946982 RepID=UPI0025D829B3|nr:zincin-like metallopeptidase domain-containing protein [Novosphingobium sp. UBA1939]
MASSHRAPARSDIYATVTAQLVAAIEAGAGEWRMPWHHSGAPTMRPANVSGRRYAGINRLVLWATAEAHGYTSGTFGTYQQWKGIGGQVRKGESGAHVVLWKRIESRNGDVHAGSDADTDTGDEGRARARCFARSFVVFNRDQVDLEDAGAVREAPPVDTSITEALAFLSRAGISIEYGLHDAHYRADVDKVFMPERTAFGSDLDLVSTLAHEIAHGSGHASRLARETLRDYHKERSIRAREELVAEICSAMIMADLGFACTPRPDHAAYLTSWLSILRHDARAIFTAAAQAQAAADWIHAAASARQGDELGGGHDDVPPLAIAA